MPFVEFLGLADIGAVATAVLLFLLLVAVAYMLESIAKALGSINLGVVTVPIGKWFYGIVHPVVNTLTSWGLGFFQVIEGWLNAAAYTVQGMFADTLSAVNTALDRIDHVITVTIPEATAHAVGGAAGYIESRIGALGREIADATTTIEHATSGEIARDLAKAEGFARTIKGDLVRIAAHDLTVAERFATGVADRAYADAKGLIDALPAIPRELTAGIDYVTPAALAAVGAAVAAITTEFEQCAVRTCAGQNNFTSLLKDALGFASLAEIGVFLAKLINDPVGAEAEYGAVFAGIARPLTTGGGDIWQAIESVLSL
jgi:hypothetical protein